MPSKTSGWAGSTGADPSPPAIRSMVMARCSASSGLIPKPGAPRFHLKGYAGCVPLRLGGMPHRKRGNRNPPLPERPRHSVAGHVFRFRCFMGLLPRAREKEVEAAARAVSNIWNPLQAGCSNFACSPAVDLSRTWGYNFGSCRPVFGQTISHRQWQQGNYETRSQRLKGLAHQRQQVVQISSAVAMSTEQCRNWCPLQRWPRNHPEEELLNKMFPLGCPAYYIFETLRKYKRLSYILAGRDNNRLENTEVGNLLFQMARRLSQSGEPTSQSASQPRNWGTKPINPQQGKSANTRMLCFLV